MPDLPSQPASSQFTILLRRNFHSIVHQVNQVSLPATAARMHHEVSSNRKSEFPTILSSVQFISIRQGQSIYRHALSFHEDHQDHPLVDRRF